MKRCNFAFAGLILLLGVFSACGDDDSSVNGEEALSSAIESSSEQESSSSHKVSSDSKSDSVDFEGVSSCSPGKPALPEPSSSDLNKPDSTEKSSSSAKGSSSSSRVRPEKDYDSKTMFVDDRDGQIYKFVTIGPQKWMAENLNYRYEGVSSNGDSLSMCYDHDEKNCDMYGRLYTWSEKMVEDICPSGWHLSSVEEWNYLLNTVGGKSKDKATVEKLRDGDLWGEVNCGETKCRIEGQDVYGFSSLPGGKFTNLPGYVVFSGIGISADFWTSTKAESDDDDGTFKSDTAMSLSLHYSGFQYYETKATGALSIRCIEDSDMAYLSCSSSSMQESSSSSLEESSSSALQSSSSAPQSSSHWLDESRYDALNDQLTDKRDGKIYKTTNIGSQIWMAENLNFAYVLDENDSNSFCFNDDPENCAVYGRMYTWAAVMDSAGKFSYGSKGCGFETECSFPSVVRGICPKGWHVPSQKEAYALISYIIDDAFGGDEEELYIGGVLRSATLWSEDAVLGTDDYGFTALPAGVMRDGGYYGLQTDARFWLSIWEDEDGDFSILNNAAYSFNIWDYDEIEVLAEKRNVALPIRCIKD